MGGRGPAHGPTTARRSLAGRSSLPRASTVVVTLGLALALFLAGGLELLTPGSRPSLYEAGTTSGFGPAPASGGDLRAARIAALQGGLRRAPADHLSWASLGLAYVEQARISADPSFYAKADGALRRSLSLDSADNFAARAGMAALASARHDFAAARRWAERGLEINPASALLYGALGDAQTQLGNYQEAFEAIQRMVDLVPDTASLARASYTWQLRGDIELATSLMQRALQDAATPADRAFARTHLGELAFDAGDPVTALGHYERGLIDDPSFVPLLAAKAKAEAALGRTDAAVSHYAEVVERSPQPSYLVEFGELLESLGRPGEAQEQYRLFSTGARLLEANGVALDVEPVMFHADHGDPRQALRYAEAGIRIRPFMDMDDAYAWALHRNGRHEEALTWSRKALSLGTRSALFHFHLGMIHESLGDVPAARAELAEALEVNPYFSPLWGPVARDVLARLGGKP